MGYLQISYLAIHILFKNYANQLYVSGIHKNIHYAGYNTHMIEYKPVHK